MLRRVLVAASGSERLQRLAGDLRPARAVAERFVAGDDLDAAIAVTRALNDAGMSVTLDHLGEAVTSEAIAEEAAGSYVAALDRLHAEGLDASISIKLTQLGLEISSELCAKLVSSLCRRAADLGTTVTVDMEGSQHTQATIDLVASLREDGHTNVGCAVQSYLHRTRDDIRRLTALGASLRLCKGAYAEPADIAFQDGDEVDGNYLACADLLLTSGTYPRFATHDHRLIARIRNLARRYELGADAYEFQMLHGVREPLQRELVDAGEALRIYVPYGREWYPYFVRRLAERPANLLFFLRALAGRRGLVGTR